MPGAHRIQRVPTTEKQGRRHSSFVTIAILDANESTTVDLTGVIETYYRAPGAGGQHRNKTDSAVRLQHPSGVVVTSAKERSQWQNRQLAWAELERRLASQATAAMSAGRNGDRVGQLSERGWTWTSWRDEVIDRSTGRRQRMSDLLKGKHFERMAR